MLASDSASMVRRWRDIVAAVTADQGGSERLSEARVQLIRRFATGAVLAEQLEARLARGQKIDLAAYSRLCNTLVRIAQAIGIDHTRPDSAPRLADVLRSQEEE